MSRKHTQTTQPTVGEISAAVETGLSYTEELEKMDQQIDEDLDVGTTDSAEQGIRVVLFDEDGPTDLGDLDVGSLAHVIGETVGEALPESLPPIGSSVPTDSSPTPPALEARPRMDAERLDARIRIMPQWMSRCPKRPGTIAYDNWHMYIDGMSVSAWLATHDRRRARTDLRWDLEHGFVYLQDPADYALEVAAEMTGEATESTSE